jgi:hypothetical protein
MNQEPNRSHTLTGKIVSSFGTGCAEKIFEAYQREQKALADGKSPEEAMLDAGLLLDTPISEQSFLEKDTKCCGGLRRDENKRMLNG